ncbi:MAG TPA: hypothetical protein VJ963_12710, partial [Bacteroidales bacterium]|nr:hypothetical protein [Bacteroidales bacterium]
MTEDIKATRLSKAAREFNVGISTIVEFLHKKGFDLDPNPNTKLPPEAYNLLVKEYSTDISVKKESEKLIFKDLHRKKETVSIEDIPEKDETEEPEKEENVLVKDTTGFSNTVDIKTEITKPDIKLVGKIDLENTKKKSPEKPAPESEEPEKKKAAPPAEADKKEEKKPASEKAPEAKTPVTENEKSKSGIDLHIVGKIDLESAKKEETKKEKAPQAEEK